MESDSDSSVERMFNKYSKRFKAEFSTRSIGMESERSPTPINVPSTSGTAAVIQLEHNGSSKKEKKKKTVKRATKKPKRATKRKRWIDMSAGTRLNDSDPDYVPTHNYAKMTSKELNNIAARVRVYHETGVVVSDDDDVVPCQSNKKKEKRMEPLQRLEKIRGDCFGKGEVGKGWTSYGARRCTCCNIRKDRCLSNLPRNTTVGAVGAGASRSVSEKDYSNIMQRLSTNAANRFKKREERLLQIQQRQLLQHPEIADLLDPNDSVNVDPIPPPAVLSHDKREWIQRFMDSMTPDRIDYEKPKQKSIVQGINHTPPETDHNAFLQKVLEKHADCLDAKTIVQRIDFKKQQERQSRLIQTKLDEHFNFAVPSSTPNFNSTELDQTANTTQNQKPADECELSPIKKEQQSLDISGIVALESDATVPRSAVAANNGLNDEPSVILAAEVATVSQNRNDAEENHQQVIGEEGSHADFSHLDRSNITIRPHKSVQDQKPAGLESNVITTNTNPRGNGPEDNIMNFVNDLLAGEEESIHKEVEERCERLLENTRKTRDVLFTAVNEYVVIDDIYENEHDNSVQIIEDIDPFPSHNNNNVQSAESNEVVTVTSDTSSDVLVVDGPSTSGSTGRGARRKKDTTTRKRKQISETSKEQVPASLSSSNSVLPADIIPKLENEEPETESSRALRDCPICLEPFSNKEISSTICGHVFCTLCIVSAIKSQKCCPNCRKRLTLKKIHPLFI